MNVSVPLHRVIWAYDKKGNVVEPMLYNAYKTQILILSTDEVLQIQGEIKDFCVAELNNQSFLDRLEDKLGRKVRVGDTLDLINDFGPDRITGSTRFVYLLSQKFKAFDLLQRKISEYELEELKKQAGPVTTEQFLKILKENKKTGHVEGKPAWWSMPQTQEVLGKFFQKTYVTIGELFDLKKVVSSFSISKEK